MNRDTYIALGIAFLTLVFIFLQKNSSETPAQVEDTTHQQFTAAYGSPLIDGNANDAAWQNAEWLPLDQAWIGQTPAPQDYAGRYKVLWDEGNLYILAEINDDVITDTHEDGLVKYWDDDCLEVFVDEDASGGNHQYNYNAFAYHIALDGKVVDIAPDSSFQYYNDHCISRRTSEGQRNIWEVAVKLYDGKKYQDGGENIPKLLKNGKVIGFALAYCDNDHSPERENFMGNVRVEGADKNRGWIDAGIFGRLTLSE
ncbi:MAG: CBM9 family sugar-binding protein [Saprospiraceae bacterium]|nr:CBM9 family sugar-binding protein [Saprospiraceae bacterium]